MFFLQTITKAYDNPEWNKFLVKSEIDKYMNFGGVSLFYHCKYIYMYLNKKKYLRIILFLINKWTIQGSHWRRRSYHRHGNREPHQSSSWNWRNWKFDGRGQETGIRAKFASRRSKAVISCRQYFPNWKQLLSFNWKCLDSLTHFLISFHYFLWVIIFHIVFRIDFIGHSFNFQVQLMMFLNRH